MKQSEISLTKLRVGQCDFDSLKDNKVLSSTLKRIHIYIHNNTNKHVNYPPPKGSGLVTAQS